MKKPESDGTILSGATPSGEMKVRLSLNSHPHPVIISSIKPNTYFSEALVSDYRHAANKAEIAKYLSSLDPVWLEALQTLDRQIDTPIGSNCRIAVCIPAFQEENNIIHTLQAFAEQTIDFDSVEIEILDNHRLNGTPDNTYEEVVKFKKEHPQIVVNYVYAVFPESTAFGAIRKLVVDLALYRGKNTAKSLVLLSADADTYGFTPGFLTNLTEEFDNNPDTDLLVGSFIYPPDAYKKYPILEASFNFHRRFREAKELDPGFRIWSAGNCSAFSASSYAAFGGQDPFAKRDIELGKKMQEFRGEIAKKFIRRYQGNVHVDPRRALLTMAKPDQALTNQFDSKEWVEDVDVRGKHWQELNLPSLEQVTVESLEKEFGATLVKKALRDGVVGHIYDLTPAETQSLSQWLIKKQELIKQILLSLSINDAKFDADRNWQIGSKKIPRPLILKSLPTISS